MQSRIAFKMDDQNINKYVFFLCNLSGIIQKWVNQTSVVAMLTNETYLLVIQEFFYRNFLNKAKQKKKNTKK